MKKIIFMFTIMLFTTLSFGQASLYTFTSTTGTFTENSATATTLAAVKADLAISTAQNIGFTLNTKVSITHNF